MKRQESTENYLETILMIKKKSGVVRSIDIANNMGFTKPSVSVAMKNFRERGFITIDSDGYITLTSQGQSIAEDIYERHLLITASLISIGVSEDIAKEDACRIEHDINEETFRKIKEYIEAKKIHIDNRKIMSNLYIITGPAGVGKSTVSEIIANKLIKSVIIEGDEIYNMVRGGYVEPWLEGNHLEVFWQNCIDLILNFLEHGYDVIFNYICAPEDIEYMKRKLSNTRMKLSVMITDKDTIIKRDKMRAEDCQMGKRSLILLNDIMNMKYDEKYYFDTTFLDEYETADEIIKNNRFLL